MSLQIKIDANGITTDTYDDIRNYLVEQYKLIYGANINLDQDTPDGQRVGIEAKLLLDTEMLAVDIVNAFDPDLAQGVNLDRISKLYGISRKAASKSTWDISVTSNANTSLPAGYKIKDALSGKEWETTANHNLTIGQNAITFTAVEFGEISGSKSDTLAQSTININVTALSPIADSSVGINEETDEQLRKRRRTSLSTKQSSGIGEMYRGLYDLNNVNSVKIYEDTKAHTIHVFVDGGAIADIGTAIAIYKDMGVNTLGDNTYTWTDTSIPNVSYRVTVHFDRPVAENYTIEISAIKDLDYEVTSSDIQSIVFSELSKIDIGSPLSIADVNRVLYSNFDNTKLAITATTLNGSTALLTPADGHYLTLPSKTAIKVTLT